MKDNLLVKRYILGIKLDQSNSISIVADVSKTIECFIVRDDVYQTMMYLDPDALYLRKQKIYQRRDYTSVVIAYYSLNYCYSNHFLMSLYVISAVFKCLIKE